MTALVSETRYLLCCEPSPGSTKAHPFATAEFTNEYEGKYFFHRLAFHEFLRDVPADCFREGVNQEDWPKAFVKPDAPTLRGLMDLKPEASLGIDPGLEFAWRRDRVKPLPAGNRMSESVVLSVPFIQLLLLNPLPVRPFIRP
jgi:hypothetical protein